MKSNRPPLYVEIALIEGKSFQKLSIEEKIALAFEKLLNMHQLKLDELPEPIEITDILKELEADYEMQEQFFRVAQNDPSNQDYGEEIRFNNE